MLINLLIGVLLLTPAITPGQSCNPASVSYIVRDEKGNALSQAELKTITNTLPKTIGDAGVSESEVSFVDANTYYWPESAEWSKGTKTPTLLLANAGTCTMQLNEVTLVYHEKKMRLVFNIQIARYQNDRRMVIDSLPFQEGTFRLQMQARESDYDKLVPATAWQKVAKP